jgi:hypothetical protein
MILISISILLFVHAAACRLLLEACLACSLSLEAFIFNFSNSQGPELRRAQGPAFIYI